MPEDQPLSVAWAVIPADLAIPEVGHREPRAVAAGGAWVPAASAGADSAEEEAVSGAVVFVADVPHAAVVQER